MAEVILRYEKFRRPIRFQHRRRQVSMDDLIFVGINNVRLAIGLQQFDRAKQSIGLEQIIVVEQRNPLALCQGQPSIQSRRNSAVNLRAGLNSGIALPHLFQQRRHARHIRTIVNQDQLPVFVDLRDDRFDGGSQKLFVRIERGYENRNQRAIRKSSRLLGYFCGFARGKSVVREPLSVLIGRVRFGLFPRPNESKWCGKDLDEASFDTAAQLLMFFAQRLQLALHILQTQQLSFKPRDMRFR